MLREGLYDVSSNKIKLGHNTYHPPTNAVPKRRSSVTTVVPGSAHLYPSPKRDRGAVATNYEAAIIPTSYIDQIRWRKCVLRSKAKRTGVCGYAKSRTTGEPKQIRTST